MAAVAITAEVGVVEDAVWAVPEALDRFGAGLAFLLLPAVDCAGEDMWFAGCMHWVVRVFLSRYVGCCRSVV